MKGVCKWFSNGKIISSPEFFLVIWLVLGSLRPFANCFILAVGDECMFMAAGGR